MSTERVAIIYDDGSMNVCPPDAGLDHAERQRANDDASMPSRIVRVSIDEFEQLAGPKKVTK